MIQEDDEDDDIVWNTLPVNPFDLHQSFKRRTEFITDEDLPFVKVFMADIQEEHSKDELDTGNSQVFSGINISHGKQWMLGLLKFQTPGKRRSCYGELSFFFVYKVIILYRWLKGSGLEDDKLKHIKHVRRWMEPDSNCMEYILLTEHLV